ncbi:MAG: tryptophan halogenase family protein [Nitrospira sp.]
MKNRQINSEFKIAIVGGGSAGYLAALTLRAFHPTVDITLIESSKIPIIGVGEATTSEIVPFLHRVLGFDQAEFYREVLPTWKLGIKFFWGPGENAYFNYPFDRGPLLEAYLFDGHSHNSTFLSALMSADRVPVLANGGSPTSLLSKVPFAYHLDNKRFVQYLQKKSAERNIRHLDHEIVDAVVCPDGQTIDSLITSDGQILTYDFYVDCTGYRSFLMEKKLGGFFQSYQSSLFTDSAIVANAPHNGTIKPYTAAETMDNGWCWSIPQRDEDHLGYVFSSAFCSPDEAMTEMQSKHPNLDGLRRVKFRSGRLDRFVKGNVAAIGNSYGFVEPLESTGIFVICRESLLLAQNLDTLQADRSTRAFMNTSVAEMWDYLRWFLAVHYRFNTRSNSPFWQECRAHADISGATGHLAAFKKNAPLHFHSTDAGPCGGHNFNEYGYDVMFFGQGISSKYSQPHLSREEYSLHVREVQALTGNSMSQCAALHLLSEKPEMLHDLLSEETWISALHLGMQRVCRYVREGKSEAAPPIPLNNYRGDQESAIYENIPAIQVDPWLCQRPGLGNNPSVHV